MSDNNVVHLDRFSRRLGQYDKWRRELADAIQAYQSWMNNYDLTEPESELRMFELLKELRGDKLTVALVGEFSRGKTELINAIFFSDYHRRLLPSTPGRTTMCPTEIRYDPNTNPCMRLLPIASRTSALSITEQKARTVGWTTIPLNLESADEMAEALEEIIKTQSVSMDEAKRLGFSLDTLPDTGGDSDSVDIPKWRHATINYPHRLMEQGLVVLDTPGLNGLGSEPELTMTALANAHAVLFVLAADTGVTRSDLDIWKQHVCIATHGHSEARIAALNKIDTLWDELSTEEKVSADIEQQITATMRTLEIERDFVFPVSATKGLLGKVRHDPALVDRSGLSALERKLSEDTITYKEQLVRDKIVGEIGAMVDGSLGLVNTRLQAYQSELEEIESLRNKSSSAIRELNARLRSQKGIYNKKAIEFNETRDLLQREVKLLLSLISLHDFDKLIVRTRKQMSKSWTTAGLRTNMAGFFEETHEVMKRVEARSERLRGLADDIYKRFHAEHGLPRVRPPTFSTRKFLKKFKNLEREAEAFRNSPAMMMTEQNYVIKKFFIALVSRARLIYMDAGNATRVWASAILKPLYQQIQDHKTMIDRRLENLDKLLGSHSSLDGRVQEITGILSELRGGADLMEDVLHRLRGEVDNESSPSSEQAMTG
ncbi:MAG: dynamin family protein [Gammaproteobacteria bacterium]|nr:dynamin family protein [Gammaproteobacteria bacterium]MDH3467054.1 dynamin family protein [Gammaproteobacteria bacterium]